jgi:hypothetical protein
MRLILFLLLIFCFWSCHGTEHSSYTKLSISTPSHESAIRSNNGDISILVVLEPSLLSGHRILITMDGQELSNGTEQSISLTNIDRGTHIIVASVIDSSSNVIISSSSTFTILRVSRDFQAHVAR